MRRPPRPGPAAQAVLRWSWVLVVVTVGVAVLVREWARVADRVSDLSAVLLVGGTLATAAAKLLLGENARLAADRHGIELSWPTALRLYNLSQLGKYVPGSVWQFVGRAVAYRDRGADYTRIRSALLTESLWVVAGAGAVGLVLSGTTVVPVVADGLGRRGLTWLAAGASAVVVLVVVLVALRGQALARYARSAVPSTRVVLVQAVIWASLGTGFWCFCRAAGVDVSWPYAVGLFAAAYAVGFAVLFAPAGLGVRDAILVAGLLPFTDGQTGLVVAIVARLAYLGVELVAVGVGEGLARVSRSRRRSAAHDVP